MERLKERLTIARRALGTLLELAAIEQPSRVERDAAIQRFEYSFEAVWKAAGRFLSVVEGVDAGSPKAIVRASREAGILSDQEAVSALEMVDDRNLTVHTYNEAVAERLYRKLQGHSELLTRWLDIIEERVTG